MRKRGVAVAATVSMIAAALLPTHARAVTLGGATQVRAAMATVDISEQVFCYGCPPVDCGCGRPDYCGCGRPDYGYPPPYRRFYSYYDPGPYHDPLDLNWGVHTRWADGYSQY